MVVIEKPVVLLCKCYSAAFDLFPGHRNNALFLLEAMKIRQLHTQVVRGRDSASVFLL